MPWRSCARLWPTIEMSKGRPMSSACDLALDYLYGELKGSDLDRYRAHLPGCERCQAELEALGAVRIAAREVFERDEMPALKVAAMTATVMAAAAEAGRGAVVEPKATPLRLVAAHGGQAGESA